MGVIVRLGHFGVGSYGFWLGYGWVGCLVVQLGVYVSLVQLCLVFLWADLGRGGVQLGLLG